MEQPGRRIIGAGTRLVPIVSIRWVLFAGGPEGLALARLGARSPPTPGFLCPETPREEGSQQHRQHHGSAAIHARGLLAGLAWDLVNDRRRDDERKTTEKRCEQPSNRRTIHASPIQKRRGTVTLKGLRETIPPECGGNLAEVPFCLKSKPAGSQGHHVGPRPVRRRDG